MTDSKRIEISAGDCATVANGAPSLDQELVEITAVKGL